MPRHHLLIARFPFGASEHPKGTNWLIQTVLKAKSDARIGEVSHLDVDDTPITMSRNRVCKVAKELKADLILMLDSDMVPDLPFQRPFWDTSFDFMLRHEGPCVIGAPYCGPPPLENVYVFRWSRAQSDHPNVDMKIEAFAREEVIYKAGMEEVAALPTGLILIDARCLDRVKPPYFEYEYSDPEQTQKCTTEDVFFTRNLSLAGVPQFCNWDSWAGHVKRKVVGKPTLLTVESVRESFREAVLSNRSRGDRMVDVSAADGVATGNADLPPGVGRAMTSPSATEKGRTYVPPPRSIYSPASPFQ